MSSHYYTSKPDGAHEYREIEYTYLGRRLSILTDANVFSKDRVDFGSSLLIQTMQMNPDAKVLDLGCGYGPVGICAALLAEAGRITMVDINERAVELARKNIARNGISHAEAMISDGVQALPADAQFDTILTNPPIRAGKEKVFEFYEGAYRHLVAGGELWVVIQKKQGADSTEKKLGEIFSDVEMVRQEKGYRIYKAKKLNT